MKLKHNQFGTAFITSLGMLGFEDAYAPFSAFMNYNLLLAINKVMDVPVVEDGTLKIGKVMNLNFGIDTRYIDDRKCRDFVHIFREIFENPKLYLRK